MTTSATATSKPAPTPETEAAKLRRLLEIEQGYTLNDTALGYLRNALEDAEERGYARGASASASSEPQQDGDDGDHGGKDSPRSAGMARRRL